MSTNQTSRKIRRKAIEQFEQSSKKGYKKSVHIPTQPKRITYSQQNTHHHSPYLHTYNQLQKEHLLHSHQTTIQYLQTQNTILKKQLIQLRLQLEQEKQLNIKIKLVLSEKDQQIIKLNNQLQEEYIKRAQQESQTNKQIINISQQQQFITQTLQQIDKLKIKVNQLTQQNHLLTNNLSPTERQQIKDRIIIKLEDQIITLKLITKEQKQKIHEYQQKERQQQNNYLGQKSYSYTNSKNNHYDPNYRRYDDYVNEKERHHEQEEYTNNHNQQQQQLPYFYQ